MDALFLSDRILISNDDCKKLVSGGVLVSFEDGTIKRIFTSQEEINSWLFIEHGAEVRRKIIQKECRLNHGLFFRFTILQAK